MGDNGGVGKTVCMVALAKRSEPNEIHSRCSDLDTENKARGSLKHFVNGSVAKRRDSHTRPISSFGQDGDSASLPG